MFLYCVNPKTFVPFFLFVLRLSGVHYRTVIITISLIDNGFFSWKTTFHLIEQLCICMFRN